MKLYHDILSGKEVVVSGIQVVAESGSIHHIHSRLGCKVQYHSKTQSFTILQRVSRWKYQRYEKSACQFVKLNVGTSDKPRWFDISMDKFIKGFD